MKSLVWENYCAFKKYVKPPIIMLERFGTFLFTPLGCGGTIFLILAAGYLIPMFDGHGIEYLGHRETAKELVRERLSKHYEVLEFRPYDTCTIHPTYKDQYIVFGHARERYTPDDETIYFRISVLIKIDEYRRVWDHSVAIDLIKPMSDDRWNSPA